MAAQLPTLDQGSTLWLEQIQKATIAGTNCAVPKKYFNVLFAWGYVEGDETAAKLSGQGMSQYIEEQQAAKKDKQKPKKSKKRKH